MDNVNNLVDKAGYRTGDPRITTKKWPFRPPYGLTGTILLVEGIVQRQDYAINILATSLSTLTLANPDGVSLPRTP